MRSPSHNDWHDWNEWEEIYHQEAERLRQSESQRNDVRRLRALRDPVERTRYELENRQRAARQADRRVRLHPDSEPRQSFQEYHESLQHDRRAGRAPRPYFDHNEPLPGNAPEGSLNIVRQYARQQESCPESRVDKMPTSSDLYKRRREREAALKEAHVPESASRREKRQAVKKARTGSVDVDKPVVPPAPVVPSSAKKTSSAKGKEPAMARTVKQPTTVEKRRSVEPLTTSQPGLRTPQLSYLPPAQRAGAGISEDASANIRKLFAADIWQASSASAKIAPAKSKTAEQPPAREQLTYPMAQGLGIPRKSPAQDHTTSPTGEDKDDDWELVSHSQAGIKAPEPSPFTIPDMEDSYHSDEEHDFVEVDKDAIEEEMAAKGIDPNARVKSGWLSWLRR